MTTKFKPGDKVVCVDDNELYGDEADLVKGNIYTVIKLIFANAVILSESSYDSGVHPAWSNARFKLYEEQDDFSDLVLTDDM